MVAWFPNDCRILGQNFNYPKNTRTGYFVMLTVLQVDSPADIRDVRALLREYTTWACTLTEDADQAPTFRGLEEELATLPGDYGPPHGRLLLARHNGAAAGCVALKSRDAATGELKRLYVRPLYRGEGIGQQLVAAIITEASRIGYRRIVLDSYWSMKAAHSIYEAAGFHRTEAPGDFPVHLKPVVVFMEIELDEYGRL